MTLSLSPCVRVFVCLCVPFFSLSVLRVCSEFFLVLKCFNSVSRKFKGCLKFQWCFKEVFRVFTESFKGVSRKFQGFFKEVSRVFQGSLREISRVFKKVLKVFQLRLRGVSSSF